MAMMIPAGPLPVNYPFHQQGQGNPPPNAYRPPQQPSRGNSLMDLFKQYNPVSWGMRQGDRLAETGFGDALGNLMEPALNWYQQNTQDYMDKKGINVFGFPQSQDAMTPPPMIDDGEEYPPPMVPMPDQVSIPVNPMMISGGSGMAGGSGVMDGSFDFPTTPTTPMQAGGSGVFDGSFGPPNPGDARPVSPLTSGQIGNIPISPYTPELRNDVPPLLNANIEGLPGLSRQYERGDVTTPGLVGGTSGQLGSALDEGGYSRDALANAIPDPIGTQYAQLQGRDEPMNVGLQSNAWDRPGVQPGIVQDMHDEIGQAFPDFNPEEQLIATRIVNSSRYATEGMTDRQKRKYIQDLHPTDKAILAEYGRWISGEGSPSQTVPNVPMPGPGPTLPSGGSGVMGPTNTPPPLLPPNTI